MLFMRFPDTFSEVIEEKYFMLPQIPKDFDSDLVWAQYLLIQYILYWHTWTLLDD